MKTLKLILIALFAAAISTNAQSKAIGLRFGGGNVSGAEISFQMPIGGDANRLELDLGWSGNDDYYSIGLVGTYQWTFDLAGVDGLGWYVGPGATLGYWHIDVAGITDSGLNLGVGGIIGIDYEFSFPLQLSLDTRPMFNITGSDDYNGYWGIALGVRYMF